MVVDQASRHHKAAARQTLARNHHSWSERESAGNAVWFGQKLRAQGIDELPPGLSAILATTEDGEVTVKPEFVFAMAASPKASVQAMITAQILEAAPGAEMTPTSLRLPENLPFENWARIGELLMAMPGSEAAIQNAAGQRP